MRANIYTTITTGKTNNQKFFALLIDPDKTKGDALIDLVKNADAVGVDFFFIGGSLLVGDHLNDCITIIQKYSTIPTVSFPGSILQVSPQTDALLFLSLISGRNAELLIGQHVIAAPLLAQTPLEIIPTGYMLVDGGQQTSVSYMSNTTPLPANKPDIAAATAIAGEMLGLKCIYADAGSGAPNAISTAIITAIQQRVNIPLIIGGGIRTSAQITSAIEAGADVVVIGNAIENNPNLLEEMVKATHGINTL